VQRAQGATFVPFFICALFAHYLRIYCTTIAQIYCKITARITHGSIVMSYICVPILAKQKTVHLFAVDERLKKKDFMLWVQMYHALIHYQ